MTGTKFVALMSAYEQSFVDVVAGSFPLTLSFHPGQPACLPHAHCTSVGPTPPTDFVDREELTYSGLVASAPIHQTPASAKDTVFGLFSSPTLCFTSGM